MPLIASLKSTKAALQPFDVGYFAGLSGVSFNVTHQTPGTDVTGQTSFAATTPTFLIYQSGAVNRVVLEEIELSQTGTVAGAAIQVYVAIDTASRYSSGGTAVVPQCVSGESSTSPTFTFTYNPTANAAGAGTRYVMSRSIAQSVGAAPHVWSFKDAVSIGATGSILVYTVAATTGPSWKFNFKVKQETIVS
jgi:hypothetical protein